MNVKSILQATFFLGLFGTYFFTSPEILSKIHKLSNDSPTDVGE